MLLAFTVQDVAERGDGVAAAEFGLEQVALLKGEALGESKAGNCLLRYRNHAVPIDGGHAHLLRAFCQSDAPDSRTRGEVEYADRTAESKVPRQLLRRRIAHGEDVVDKLLKELAP